MQRYIFKERSIYVQDNLCSFLDELKKLVDTHPEVELSPIDFVAADQDPPAKSSKKGGTILQRDTYMHDTQTSLHYGKSIKLIFLRSNSTKYCTCRWPSNQERQERLVIL